MGRKPRGIISESRKPHGYGWKTMGGFRDRLGDDGGNKSNTEFGRFFAIEHTTNITTSLNRHQAPSHASELPLRPLIIKTPAFL